MIVSSRLPFSQRPKIKDLLNHMSFLNNLFNDPKYQTSDPRQPEQIDDPEIIISPDTRRDNRIPPGQSRTKKWPVLDAHGTPDVDLATWTFEVDGLVEKPL